LVNLTTLIAFWKRKESPSAPEPQRIIPLPSISGVSLESSRSTSEEAVNHARDSLKILRLERQILGAALTTIYESHSKGLITEPERDQLLEKYKVDLTRLDKAIEENQRVVDLFDLESAREVLVRDFKARLAEIDAQVKTLKSGGSVTRTEKTTRENEKKRNPTRDEDKKSPGGQEQSAKKSSESEQQQITDAEKRIEQIRAEILKAMDRLEQIEAEG
jgi:hypothetical protein